MGTDDELKAIVDKTKEFAESEKSKLDAYYNSTLNELKKTGENLNSEFDSIVRRYKGDFNREVDDLRKGAQESLDKIKSTFVTIAGGLIALLFIAVTIAIYPSFRDVNSLQKDIMSIRTFVDGEKEKLNEKIEELEASNNNLKSNIKKATDQLTATQAIYQKRIQEMKTARESGLNN